MIVRSAGHRTLTTHVFGADSSYLDSDAVFAVKPSLVRRFTADQPTPDGAPDGAPALSVGCDLVLASAGLKRCGNWRTVAHAAGVKPASLPALASECWQSRL